MKEDIQYRIKKCETCQRNKLKRVKTRQSVQITDTPQRTRQKISMDLVGSLPMTSNSNRYILSIQDHLSRFVIVAPLKDQAAESVADALINKFVTLFGSPKTIVTDRGSQFCSALLKAIAIRFRIWKIETTAFSPWQNLARECIPFCAFIYAISFEKRQNGIKFWI